MGIIKLKMSKRQHTNLKIYAAQNNKTLGSIIREAIESSPPYEEIDSEEYVYTTASLDDVHVERLRTVASILRSDISGALCFILDGNEIWRNDE
jgi:Ser-tRNA(Ala) deacylase AlaX